MSANRKWLGGSFVSSSEKETRALAREFASRGDLPPAMVLRGPLGAGKTRFVQGLAEGLQASTAVVSPTYALVQEYSTPRGPLFHFDFYRLRSEREVWDLGFEEYLADGLVVAEWGEKFPGVFPPETWLWSISLAEPGRVLRCELFAPETGTRAEEQ
jgi:tRNA threonylcarbamoyladenosine biosynthesis protein TsaE